MAHSRLSAPADCGPDTEQLGDSGNGGGGNDHVGTTNLVVGSSARLTKYFFLD